MCNGHTVPDSWEIGDLSTIKVGQRVWKAQDCPAKIYITYLQEEGRGQAQFAMTTEANEAAIVDLGTSYVGKGVDRDTPMAQQGLDSLAAMELRQKLQVKCAVLARFSLPKSTLI